MNDHPLAEACIYMCRQCGKKRNSILICASVILCTYTALTPLVLSSQRHRKVKKAMDVKEVVLDAPPAPVGVNIFLPTVLVQNRSSVLENFDLPIATEVDWTVYRLGLHEVHYQTKELKKKLGVFNITHQMVQQLAEEELLKRKRRIKDRYIKQQRRAMTQAGCRYDFAEARHSSEELELLFPADGDLPSHYELTGEGKKRSEDRGRTERSEERGRRERSEERGQRETQD